MPIGRVKWFDPARGYGFLTADDGHDVYLPASALPAGVRKVAKGTKVEFSEADGRRGPAALSVEIQGPRPSMVAASRPRPEDMAAVCEDLIKVLDKAGNTLRRGHYPGRETSHRVAQLLRRVADDFDVED